MRLLQLLPSLDPRGGGPAEGVLQSGLIIAGQGHRLDIATLDAPGAPFLRGYPLPVHALGPSHTRYRYNARLVPWLRDRARDYDAVIVNGLWQYHGLGAWRALRASGVSYYVFTHGMLDPWFKRTYRLKHLKKWLYWPWAEFRLLRDARGVMFTTEEERRLARESFRLYRARELVVPFGTGTPPQEAAALRERFLAAFPALRGKRLLLFLGRVHPKKGCDLLIDAFARVAADADPALHLVMAGPDQAGWADTLRQRARQLGIAERTSWTGMLGGDLKWGAFHASEVFVLPSHQENFGIAVAEALGCGVPVLISDKVNIWREVQADGAGLVGPDTLEGTEQLLRRWLACSVAERGRMVGAASRCFRDRFTAEAMSHGLLTLIARDLDGTAAA